MYPVWLCTKSKLGYAMVIPLKIFNSWSSDEFFNTLWTLAMH